MTTPLSLTSSRYTGAEARRSLERVSVVSIITSCPIQASGILSSESEALGLSYPSWLPPPCSLFSRKCRIPLPKTPLPSADQDRERRQRLSEPHSGSIDRGEDATLEGARVGFSNVCYNI